MPSSPMQLLRERRAIRQALAGWRRDGVLVPAAARLAWTRTEPGAADWRGWLDLALLALGAALLCVGVIVFFAFNWQDLHKFAKFGLLAALITALAAFALPRRPGDLAAQAALAGAQVLTGALLAVIGQVYQTGADAWQLFALWALLAVPWALAARAAPHWWVVLVVGNVALLRYCSIRLGVGGMFELLFGERGGLATSLLLLLATAVQLALWYGLCALAPALGFRGQAGARIAGALACAYATWLGLASLLQSAVAGGYYLCALAALAALGAWVYLRAFDIVLLSLASFSAIVLGIGGAGHWLLRGSADYGVFLLLGLLTVALAGGAASWLLRAHRRHVMGAQA
ncbi:MULTISPECIES: DUF2157 domain-containing protein [unclassified Cupriavidus]|uniref:DUF2157 domain-containing protein n=1 Tax=unclassified Cupriavidus TaxID=2640874 RepID=UPI001E57CBFB|nr:MULTISPECIES: DUF2157 domain-containing protein [unclassified Cupriavidus]